MLRKKSHKIAVKIQLDRDFRRWSWPREEVKSGGQSVCVCISEHILMFGRQAKAFVPKLSPRFLRSLPQPLIQKMFQALMVPLSLVVSAGCQQQGDERLKEKASIEQRVMLDEHYKKLDQRASAFQDELNLIHRFNRAVSGTYRGVLVDPNFSSGEFKPGAGDVVAGADDLLSSKSMGAIPKEWSAQMIVAARWPYQPSENGRVRSLEELNLELSQVGLNVQFRAEIPGRENSAVGCNFSDLRPDLAQGTLTLLASECAMVMRLELAGLSLAHEGGSQGLKVSVLRTWATPLEFISQFDRVRASVSSAELSQKAQRGQLTETPGWIGFADPKQRAVSYRVKLIKVEGVL